ncbi:MAG: MCP four helix bundle domain-containing protein [Chloroflexi bacterium]|nr:MCP four helix bundle domain-containing protein [Chloroflexota bacterium]
MWLNDTSISQRLTLGFGIVFLLVMLLLGVHVYEQQRLNESIAQLTDQIMPRADAASNIETAYLRESADVRSYVLSGNERYLAAYNKAVASSQNALASLDKMLKTKEGRELFDQIQPLAAQYTEAAVKAIALRQQGKLAEAQQTIEQEMLPMREQLLEKADAFVALEFSLRNQAKSDVGKTQSDTNLLSIVVAFLSSD